jgi:hypothetical protein
MRIESFADQVILAGKTADASHVMSAKNVGNHDSISLDEAV